MSIRRSLLVGLLALTALGTTATAPDAQEGTLTIGVHVTLVNRWLDPA